MDAGTITINKIDSQWVAKITGCDEWLPLPFAPQASRDDLAAFYQGRFDQVIMDPSVLGW